MYLPVHLEQHPFGRVPALKHGDFMLYETNAIAAYVDEVFPGPRLTPDDARKRARMNSGSAISTGTSIRSSSTT
jgi:glutathione S-transferase